MTDPTLQQMDGEGTDVVSDAPIALVGNGLLIADSGISAPQTLTFNPGGKTAFSITGEGRLVAGDGLSDEEATRALFDSLVNIWPHLIAQWAEAQGWEKQS